MNSSAKRPASEHSVHPVYVRMLCSLLKQHGQDADAALAAVGLRAEQLTNNDDYLPFEAFKNLAVATRERLGRPWLGLEMGMLYQAPAHGPEGIAVVTSATLRDALKTVNRLGGLRVHQYVSTYSEDSREGVLRVHLRAPADSARDLLYETMFATLLRMFELAVGNCFDRFEVRLPYPAPAWRDRYAQFGIGKLAFGGECLEFHVPRELLDRATLTADAKLCEGAMREALEREHLVRSAPLTLRVRDLVHRSLATEQRAPRCPDIQAVAGELHVSPRTLIRKLKQEGSNYQALVDEVRAEFAVWLLQHTRQSMGEIAFRLGFEDTSSFNRAFKRWKGSAPKEFR